MQYLFGEILVQIYSYLDGADLVRASSVCSHWRMVADDEVINADNIFKYFQYLWTRMCESLEPPIGAMTKLHSPSKKEEYKLKYTIQRNIKRGFTLQYISI